MNRLFTILSLTVLGLIAANCNKDDGNGNTVVNLRDRKEVRDENDKQIKEYLEKNYLILDGENIRFDSLSNPNATSKIPLIQDKRIEIIYQEITSDNYEYEAIRLSNGSTSLKYTKPKDSLAYTIAYFIVPDAVGTKQEGKEHSISTIDSVFVKTKSISLKNEQFTTNGMGNYFSFPVTIKEFAYMSQGNYQMIPAQLKTAERQILTKVKTATGVKTSSDGTPIYDKGSAGRIIAFIPSGVGYFNAGFGSKLKAYQPHIIDMTLVSRKERDHDGDGILSKYEAKKVIEKSLQLGRALTDQEILDLKLTIKDYFGFDTDEDGRPNFLDDDDDGDGVLTKVELQYKDANNKKAYYPYSHSELLKPCGTTYRYLDRSCFPDIDKEGFPDWSKAGKK
ncbi:EF-hand domain-containing protein [Myroides sp. M-43]|uniref:EF-hand domain-containing protein n=1 Tax=Myroides oncorhynchi TaxID=2893756 RepID=UPI001E3DC995|nr:EF-hand domain-containing protein [Myroides oncorhynchi]MCC9041373.1 EF-hand domain-containing protein [Myroides oncorhynchi]